jgi:nicotinate (nicotinamide) nucleotide adenylyltransferase
MARKRRVAVFGGAFDPPTLSHIMSLAEVVNSGMVDEAVLVPCGPRPDKPRLRPALVRYTMCQIAVSSSFSPAMPVRASDLEVFEPLALPTYTALCRLRELDPGADFMFVIGSDWLQPGSDLRSWKSKDPETGEEICTGDMLVKEFDFFIIKRPGYEVEDVTAFGPRMKWLEMSHGMKRVEANLSSTEVRTRAGLDYRLNSGKLELIDGIVPPAVYSFVKREGIFRPGASMKWLK